MSRHFLAFSLGFLAAVACTAGAFAAPRDSAARATPPRSSGPSATIPQTEPMDLDEGKSGAQMFSNACVVCHQSPQGLAKGRAVGALGSFLRQHYTTGSTQADKLANFLTTGGLDRGTPVPVRAIPGDKPDKPADKPVVAEPAVTRRPKPEDARPRPEPETAAQRRIRNEDGTTQPVEGLVVLPPNAEQLPEHDGKPDRRRDARPAEPVVTPPVATPGRQRQPRPSDIKPAEAKPVEPAKPVETAKPAEPEPAPAPAVVEAPRPPRDPAAAHSTLTEEKEKPAPSQVQEIPL